MQFLVASLHNRASDLPELYHVSPRQYTTKQEDPLRHLSPLIGCQVVIQNPKDETQAYSGVVSNSNGRTLVHPFTDNYTLPFDNLPTLFNYLFPNQRLPAILENHLFVSNGHVFCPVSSLL